MINKAIPKKDYTQSPINTMGSQIKPLQEEKTRYQPSTSDLIIVARNGIKITIVDGRTFDDDIIELIQKRHTKSLAFIGLGTFGFFTVDDNYVVRKQTFK